MPPAATAPTEAELAANIDATLRGTPIVEVDDPPAEIEAEPGTLPEDDGTDAGSEATTQPKTTKDQPPAHDAKGTQAQPSEMTREMASIKESLAELRGMIAGRGKDAQTTVPADGAAAPSDGADKGPKTTLADIRARIKAAKEANGDVVTVDVLEGLVETLEAKIGEIDKERTDRKTAEQTQAEQVRQASIREVHRTFTEIAKADPKLTELMGTGHPSTHTESQQGVRLAVYDEAKAQMQKSMRRVELGLATKPLTENQAILAAVKEITGHEAKTFVQDKATQQAKDRARHVRPESGGSTQRPGAESGKTSEQDLVAMADAFLRGG